MADERREHERIPIEMRTRLWLEESYRSQQVVFEGFSETQNLSIGGAFLASSYLLPIGFPVNLEIEIGSEQILSVRGEVVHCLGEEDPYPGMGVVFTEVDPENRERLLRFFVSNRIREFYGKRFLREFPHLENQLSLEDIALIVNLWEDEEMRITRLTKPTRS